MQADYLATAHPLLAAITIMGSGRLGPTVSAVIGLVGVVIGGLALTRARGGTHADSDIIVTSGPGGATAALVLGLISLAFGVLFLATADGGPGTGNGVVASFAAIVLGPIAMIIGGVAQTRGRRTG